MQNKTMGMGVIIAIVFAAGGFYGGTTYAGSKTATRSATGSFAGGQFAGRTGAAGVQARGGTNAVFGTVIAKDATSITVQLGGPGATSTNGTNTGSKIVLLDSNTQIDKTVPGAATDLTVGTAVTANGTANSDGSITATNVQIRPMGALPRGQ